VSKPVCLHQPPVRSVVPFPYAMDQVRDFAGGEQPSVQSCSRGKAKLTCGAFKIRCRTHLLSKATTHVAIRARDCFYCYRILTSCSLCCTFKTALPLKTAPILPRTAFYCPAKWLKTLNSPRSLRKPSRKPLQQLPHPSRNLYSQTTQALLTRPKTRQNQHQTS
jgi:hypothetical protein